MNAAKKDFISVRRDHLQNITKNTPRKKENYLLLLSSLLTDVTEEFSFSKNRNEIFQAVVKVC